MLGELHRQSCEPGTSAWFVFHCQVGSEQTVGIATFLRLWSAVTVWVASSWVCSLLWLDFRSQWLPRVSTSGYMTQCRVMQPAQYTAWNHLAMCECGYKLHGAALSCTMMYSLYKSVQTLCLPSAE